MLACTAFFSGTFCNTVPGQHLSWRAAMRVSVCECAFALCTSTRLILDPFASSHSLSRYFMPGRYYGCFLSVIVSLIYMYTSLLYLYMFILYGRGHVGRFDPNDLMPAVNRVGAICLRRFPCWISLRCIRLNHLCNINVDHQPVEEDGLGMTVGARNSAGG